MMKLLTLKSNWGGEAWYIDDKIICCEIIHGNSRRILKQGIGEIVKLSINGVIFDAKIVERERVDWGHGAKSIWNTIDFAISVEHAALGQFDVLLSEHIHKGDVWIEV